MHLPYIPARLVEAKAGWYIVYYQFNPITERTERFREKHNLNRIPNPQLRRERAQSIVKHINYKLPAGYPFEAERDAILTQTPIGKAIEKALEIKCADASKRTRDGLESTARIFTGWLTREDKLDMPVISFSTIEALKFMDYVLLTREVGGRTYNNYRERVHAMFTVLKKREYIRTNPFSEISKKKESSKIRRIFSDQERDIVWDEIRRKDKWLMLYVLLQYHCLIRPIEQRRMRIQMMDVDAQIIRLTPEVTKNNKSRSVTIPDVMINFLREFNLQEHYNPGWILCGARGLPHDSKSASHQTIYTRHKKILEDLRERGKLANIDGLHFYSWKDNGIYEMFKKGVNPRQIQRQAGHSSLDYTMRYGESLYVFNEEIKVLDNALGGY